MGLSHRIQLDADHVARREERPPGLRRSFRAGQLHHALVHHFPHGLSLVLLRDDAGGMENGNDTPGVGAGNARLTGCRGTALRTSQRRRQQTGRQKLSAVMCHWSPSAKYWLLYRDHESPGKHRESLT